MKQIEQLRNISPNYGMSLSCPANEQYCSYLEGVYCDAAVQHTK